MVIGDPLGIDLNQISRGSIKRAGHLLAKSKPGEDSRNYDKALRLMQVWREMHDEPLWQIHRLIHENLPQVEGDIFITHRLKREESIINKLREQTITDLTSMQDIGGLRVVVADGEMIELVSQGIVAALSDHQIVREKDYLTSPRSTGYRSLHKIVRFGAEQKSPFTGLRLELQIRTRLQHCWATAVEIMDVIDTSAAMKQAEKDGSVFPGYRGLKAGKGSEEWRDFFAVTASAFAHEERMEPVPGYSELDENDTRARVAQMAKELGVELKFKGWAVSLEKVSEHAKRGYHVLTLHLANRTATYTSFEPHEQGKAIAEYNSMEARISKGEPLQSVLVSNEDVLSICDAYPNYFSYSSGFLEELERIAG